MEYECSSGTRDSFLADNALITEISIDSMFLCHLLAELRESDPESYQILMVLAEGLSERAGAEQLYMLRNTVNLRKEENRMSKMSDMTATIEELRTAAATIKDLADWLAETFSGADDANSATPADAEVLTDAT